jgi:hypothetical protein
VSPGTCNDTFGTRVPTSSRLAPRGRQHLGRLHPDRHRVPRPGTTYYFCAIAQNAVGVAPRKPPQLRSPPALPEVATFDGRRPSPRRPPPQRLGQPNGNTATGWFRYSTTNPGTCNDTFGTRAPTSGGTALGAGTAPVALYARRSRPLARHHLLLLRDRQNAIGTSFGAVLSFTTPPTRARGDHQRGDLGHRRQRDLNGTANPNGGATTGWFRYSTTSPGTCNDTFGTRAPGERRHRARRRRPPRSPFTARLIGRPHRRDLLLLRDRLRTRWARRFGSVLSFTTTAAPSVATTPRAASLHHRRDAQRLGQPQRSSPPPAGSATAPPTPAPATTPSARARRPAAAPRSARARPGRLHPADHRPHRRHDVLLLRDRLERDRHGLRRGAVVHHAGRAGGHHRAPTLVTSTTATLNGTATPTSRPRPAGSATRPPAPASCNDTFGTRAPTSGGTALGAGSARSRSARPSPASPPARPTSTARSRRTRSAPASARCAVVHHAGRRRP